MQLLEVGVHGGRVKPQPPGRLLAPVTETVRPGPRDQQEVPGSDGQVGAAKPELARPPQTAEDPRPEMLPGVRRLTGYWLDGYDWRAAEARLNAYPQFITEIDGQDIHFLHVRSPEPGALPLILTHGWPGSVVEYLDVIGPLADPRAHGRDPSIAFDLVIPSLPGFAFSSPLTSRGWGTTRTAAAWAGLMRRLGYQRYGAAGTTRARCPHRRSAGSTPTT